MILCFTNTPTTQVCRLLLLTTGLRWCRITGRLLYLHLLRGGTVHSSAAGCGVVGLQWLRQGWRWRGRRRHREVVANQTASRSDEFWSLCLERKFYHWKSMLSMLPDGPMHTETSCSCSWMRSSTITTFGSVFFSFRRFWMTCCIVLLDRNFTRIGLVLPALFTPTR